MDSIQTVDCIGMGKLTWFPEAPGPGRQCTSSHLQWEWGRQPPNPQTKLSQRCTCVWETENQWVSWCSRLPWSTCLSFPPSQLLDQTSLPTHVSWTPGVIANLLTLKNRIGTETESQVAVGFLHTPCRRRIYFKTRMKPYPSQLAKWCLEDLAREV